MAVRQTRQLPQQIQRTQYHESIDSKLTFFVTNRH